MQTAQRSILIWVTAVCMIAGISFLFGEREEKGEKQWEQMQAEVFLDRISRHGYCSYEDYLMFRTELEVYGDYLEVRLEEYQREKDRQGQRYWYQISWEEIRDVLQAEGVYCFQKNSALKLYIKHDNRQGGNVEIYYDIVL